MLGLWLMASAGCMSGSPFAGSPPADGGAERSPEAPVPPDATEERSDGGNGDAARDLGSADAAGDLGNAEASRDLGNGDAPFDLGNGDAPADLANGDAPAEVGPTDAPAGDGSADASEVRPEDLPCGPLAFLCTPYACNRALGVCKTACATDDDCSAGVVCQSGACGGRQPDRCSSNAECASGFCAQSVCCATSCSDACKSCAVPGSIGTCTFVPAGALDPANICLPSTRCDGHGVCIAPSCTVDSDCGTLHWCTGQRCIPCVGLCVVDAECLSNYCVHRNGCSTCEVRDAGGG
jgi:hypothetical protein